MRRSNRIYRKNKVYSNAVTRFRPRPAKLKLKRSVLYFTAAVWVRSFFSELIIYKKKEVSLWIQVTAARNRQAEVLRIIAVILFL